MSHGGKRRGAGRKTKAREQTVVERLSPYADEWTKQVVRAMKNGDAWAVKLFAEYLFGKPKQTMDVTSDGKAVNPATIMIMDASSQDK